MVVAKQLLALVLPAVLLAFASCDQAAEKTNPLPGVEAAIAQCQQAVRKEAENPQSVSFGDMLDDYSKELRRLNSWVLYGNFTQSVGDRSVVPHFYICTIGEIPFVGPEIYSGHAADYDQTASRLKCKQAIAQRSEFPDRADFKPDGAKYDWGSLPHFTFQGTVDLMNGSGEMISHDYFCNINHGEILDLRLTEKK